MVFENIRSLLFVKPETARFQKIKCLLEEHSWFLGLLASGFVMISCLYILTMLIRMYEGTVSFEAETGFGIAGFQI